MSFKRPLAEPIAAALTGALHPIFADVLRARAVFIVVALVGWTSYLVFRVCGDRATLSNWGFGTSGLRQSCVAAGIVFAVAGLVMAAVANARGIPLLRPHMLPLLLLYPVWGLLQQTLVQAMFVRNVALGPRKLLPAGITAIAAAALFGVVHLPDATLTLATFLMGLAFTAIYLRWRNLWPLGLCHGWLGVGFYFWILNRDPWTGVFG